MTRRHDGTLPEGATPRATGRRAVVQRILHLARQIIGAPDYQAYLDHCRAAGHPALDEREYVRQFFEAKGTGTRCC